MRRENDLQWRREAFVQAGAFGLGIVGGSMIADVVALTPAGLVIGLVVGGAAAVGADYLLQDAIGSMYDLFTQ